MTRNQWLIVIAIILLLALGGGVAYVASADDDIDELEDLYVPEPITGRGKPLTHAPADGNGVVQADPQSLANACNLDLRTYALARMLASENPRDTDLVRIAVAWVCCNEAARENTTPEQLLLRSTRPDRNGKFGSQLGGYASTTNDPVPQDVQIAQRVLAPPTADNYAADPTGGAVQFDSPRAQRAALARGAPGYVSTPEQVAAERQSEGKVQVTLPGVDPDYMRFWRYA